MRKNIFRKMRNAYISEYRWRKLKKKTRQKLLKYFSKKFYVGRYVANIVNDIRRYTKTKKEEREVLNALDDALFEMFE